MRTNFASLDNDPRMRPTQDARARRNLARRQARAGAAAQRYKNIGAGYTPAIYEQKKQRPKSHPTHRPGTSPCNVAAMQQRIDKG